MKKRPLSLNPRKATRIHASMHPFRVFLWAFILFVLPALPAASPAHAAVPYKVGDQVCVQWDADWKWYDAEVLAVGSDTIKIHYTGYDSSWDEWVKPESVIARFQFNVGDPVWINWGTGYYMGKVVGKTATQCKVHYSGYPTSDDEWVELCKVFPRPKAGDPVWVEWRLGWYYCRVIEVLKTNLWKVHYVGYDSNWDEEVTPSRIIYCSPAQAAQMEAELKKAAPAVPPAGQQIFKYGPAESPYTTNDPSKAKPVAAGPAAAGGNAFTLEVALHKFSAPVDIYLALSFPGVSELYFWGAGNYLAPASKGIKPLATKVTEFQKVLIKDVPADKMPVGHYGLYLLVTPAGKADRFYLWMTGFRIDNLGAFTGQKRVCGNDLPALIQPLITEMENKGSPTWYAKVRKFLSEYKDAEGNLNPREALDNFIWAAYLEDNVYPFCWGALKAVENDPTDPMALNTAAVALLELGKTKAAGRLLDCAYFSDPGFSPTHENASYYFEKNGNTSRALEEKKKAVEAGPQNPHAAWDGFQWAVSKGLPGAAAFFDSRIPSNYSLLKGGGKQGSAPPVTKVCCGCGENAGFYDSVVECAGKCSAGLGCFTDICSPNMACCGDLSVFGFEAGVCYPPVGFHACFEVDDKGNFTVKVGAGLGPLFGAYLGASTNFSRNHNVFIAVKGPGTGKVKITLLSSDPNAKKAAFVFNPSTSDIKSKVGLNSTVSFGMNFSPSNWIRAMLCSASSTSP